MKADPTIALVVVDAQEGFRDSNTDPVYRRLPDAASCYQTIIQRRFGNGPESPVWKLKEWEKMPAGSPETGLVFAPAPDQRARVVEKSGFSGLDLAAIEWLHGLGIREVHIAGNDTDLCVSLTAYRALESGFLPVILEDLTASTGGEARHAAGLVFLRRMLGRDRVRRFEPGQSAS